MNAAYTTPEAAVVKGSTRIQVRFQLRNNSRDSWDPSQVLLGWQLYDPASGRFVTEGEWTTLPSPISPGVEFPVSVDLQLPAAPGSYRVYISPLHTAHGWFYARGGAMVVVDADVRDSSASLSRIRATTLAALRRERIVPFIKHFFTAPFETLFANRALIRSMSRREILARYRGSFGDTLWTILYPLLLMATYFFVFGVVLQSRFGPDQSRTGFALYFLAGMLPWLAFSEPATRSTFVVLEHRSFVKKLVFPVAILPVNQVIAGLLTSLFATALYLIALYALRGSIPATAAFLPVLLVPQVLFTLGLCWLLAATGVFIRDLAQVITFLLTLWFFLTPICYPESSLPPELIPILAKNPMFQIVRGYRTILLESQLPPIPAILKLWAVALAMFFLGHAWFARLRRTFADVI